jgi:hypothetical protein
MVQTSEDLVHCFVFSWEVTTQLQPQEGTKERHRGKEVVILAGPREKVTTCQGRVNEQRDREDP